MFNTEINNKQNYSFKNSSVSGSLFKSCDKSFFTRFHLQSGLAKQILTDNPTYNRMPIVVLQIMICGDMEVIIELVDKNSYDEMINKNRGE